MRNAQYGLENVSGFNDLSMRGTQSLSDEGFTGVRTGNEENVFDPNNIRSTNARFDPRLSELENIMAANASKPLGILVLEQQARGNERLGGLLESLGMDINDLSTADPREIQGVLNMATRRGILDKRSADGLKRGLLD